MDRIENCVILASCPVSPDMRRYISEKAFVIACDAGYRNLQPLHIKADLYLGDYDSAQKPENTDAIVLPCVKDDTDTQYAANWAYEHGSKNVLILGGLGGKRTGHTIANFCTGMFLQKKGVHTVLADETTEVHFLCETECLSLQKNDWKYFSVFPWEGTAEGVSIKGAYYELKDAVLRSDYPLGVSNEFVSDAVEISARKGSLVVILEKPDNIQ